MSTRATNTWPRSPEQTTWWQYVLFVAFVVVMGTGATFAAGVVNFSNNPPEGDYKPEPVDLLKDTTFFILLSQSLPNLLASFFEFMKVGYDQATPWKNRVVFLAAQVLVIGLSLAAPLVYVEGSRDTLKAWTSTQVYTMILSACASLATAIAGMISVFEAGHAKQKRVWDEERREKEKNRTSVENVQASQRIQELEAEVEEKARQIKEWEKLLRSKRLRLMGIRKKRPAASTGSDSGSQ